MQNELQAWFVVGFSFTLGAVFAVILVWGILVGLGFSFRQMTRWTED